MFVSCIRADTNPFPELIFSTEVKPFDQLFAVPEFIKSPPVAVTPDKFPNVGVKVFEVAILFADNHNLLLAPPKIDPKLKFAILL